MAGAVSGMPPGNEVIQKVESGPCGTGREGYGRGGILSMLRESALANALAIVTAGFYLMLSLIGLVSPMLFRSVFNAQFLGANVASLLPQMSFGTFIVTLVILVVSVWLFGYAWAWLYNLFAKIF